MREFQLYALPEIDEEAMEHLAAHETSAGALARADRRQRRTTTSPRRSRRSTPGSPERAAADIDTFLAALRARGLTGH